MIDNEIFQSIQSELKKIESQHNISIVYACESGSRAWGFASPDSDYDVRFIYRRSEDYYLSLEKKADTLDFPLSGDLDIGGWDLSKVLQHIKKSNAVISEWLQSPVVYYEAEGIKKELLDLAYEFSSLPSMVHHYLGISRKAYGSIDEKGFITIKKIFYVLRPLLAAYYITQKKTIAPMEFKDLYEQVEDLDVRSEIDRLLHEKKGADEKERVSLPMVLVDYITAMVQRIGIDSQKLSPHAKEWSSLNNFFIEEIKKDF